MKFIDLHTHTTCSDGFYTPRELIDKAQSYGLVGLSISDHDTLKAYDDLEIFDYAKQKGIELIPGIEFSTIDEKGRKYHILGYLIDLRNKELLQLIEKIKNIRTSYVYKVNELLSNDGFYINADELLSSGDSITKAHISRALLNDVRNRENILSIFGHIPGEGELTEGLLIKGKKYFVEKDDALSPGVVIKVIHEAGGISILAHPAFNVMNGENLGELCDRFVNMGVDGFEAINIQFNKSNGDERVDYVDGFSSFATSNNLLITGGSDYHHSDKNLMGNFIDLGFKGDEYKVSCDILEKLKNYKDNKIT